MNLSAFFKVGLCVVVCLWLAAPVALLLYFGKPGNAGEFCDLFGSVNALFTGLAFAGLLFTINIQREELTLQRQELQLTREELRAASEAQAKSAHALAQQLQKDRLAREMTFAIEQFDNLNEDWSLNVRQEIFASPDITALASDPERLRRVERFLNYLNHVGYLIAKGFLPPRPTLELFYITVVRLWTTLGGHIIQQRQHRGIYLHHLEWLAFEAFEFWETGHPETKIAIHNPTNNTSVVVDRALLKTQLTTNRANVLRYIEQSARIVAS